MSAWVTRAGTRVLQVTARAKAATMEIYGGDAVAEYRVYRDFRVGDRDNPRFDACDGDNLLAKDSELDGMAHVLNLVTGQSGLIPWNAMAHSVKPVERLVRNL